MATVSTAWPSRAATAGEPASAERSSARWSRHFRVNGSRLLEVPWERGAELSDRERDLIAGSLAEFQQGEGQEGGHFFHCARAYAERTGDWGYVEAHRLFMAEEGRHARDLARFLALAGVPLLTERSWLTRGFCWCGSRGGLETTLQIILMSEIMGQVYYAALRRAAGSIVLRRLCTQILRDEQAHVRFQCERLALLRRGRGRLALALTHYLDLALFVAAVLCLWCGHRRVLGAGGFGFRAFWRAARNRRLQAWKQKDPRRSFQSAFAEGRKDG
jgi:hypothetical protein